MYRKGFPLSPFRVRRLPRANGGHRVALPRDQACLRRSRAAARLSSMRAHRLCLKVGDRVAVDVQRRGRHGVSQERLHGVNVGAVGQQPRRGRMPQRVECCAHNAGAPRELRERLGQCIGCQHLPERIGEHEVPGVRETGSKAFFHGLGAAGT